MRNIKQWLARLILWVIDQGVADLWWGRVEERVRERCEDAVATSDGSADYQSLVGTPPRSSRWPRVRELHLIVQPQCALCGGTENLEVHHIEPFHLAPQKELDSKNLITLCEKSARLPGLNCHLFAGHLGRWSSINPRVREFCAKVAELLFSHRKISDTDRESHRAQ